MRKLALWISAMALLSGCDLLGTWDDQAKNCQELSKYLAKSPSTVKFVDTTIYSHEPDEKVILLKLDSQNSYGATVRSNVKCIYPIVDGEVEKNTEHVEWDYQKIDPFTLISAKAESLTDRIHGLTK